MKRKNFVLVEFIVVRGQSGKSKLWARAVEARNSRYDVMPASCVDSSPVQDG